MAQHPRDAGIHLRLFKQFAARNLIQGQLHPLIEPRIFRQQAIDGFSYEFLGAAPGARRKPGERCGLLFGELEFHSSKAMEFEIPCQAGRMESSQST